jgi:hypothetical protein
MMLLTVFSYLLPSIETSKDVTRRLEGCGFFGVNTKLTSSSEVASRSHLREQGKYAWNAKQILAFEGGEISEGRYHNLERGLSPEIYLSHSGA